MPSVAEQTKGIISQLFSPSGVGGISFVVSATLELRQSGEYSPTTGQMGQGLYWDPKSQRYASPVPPTVPVIQKPTKARDVDWGQTQQTIFLMEPMAGLNPKSLVGSGLTVQGIPYQIMDATGTSLGVDQIIWELGCQ